MKNNNKNDGQKNNPGRQNQDQGKQNVKKSGGQQDQQKPQGKEHSDTEHPHQQETPTAQPGE
jgi:hypothetical protein